MSRMPACPKDLKATNEELAKANEYYAQLKPSCIEARPDLAGCGRAGGQGHWASASSSQQPAALDAPSGLPVSRGAPSRILLFGWAPFCRAGLSFPPPGCLLGRLAGRWVGPAPPQVHVSYEERVAGRKAEIQAPGR